MKNIRDCQSVKWDTIWGNWDPIKGKWDTLIWVSILVCLAISFSELNETGQIFYWGELWMAGPCVLLAALGWMLCHHHWGRVLWLISLTLLAWVVVVSIVDDTAKLYTGRPWMAGPWALLAALGWRLRHRCWANVLWQVSLPLAVWFVAGVDLISNSELFFWVMPFHLVVYFSLYVKWREKRRDNSTDSGEQARSHGSVGGAATAI